jgi:hypothetical protein
MWDTFSRAWAPTFSEPVFIEKLIQEPDYLSSLISNAIRTATQRMHQDFRIRAFREGSLDYRLTDALTRAPSNGNHPNDWLAEVANDPYACAAINSLSTWDTELAAWSRSLIKVVLNNQSYELLSGADTYSFIAEAGWTPFAIHKDSEPSLIFHLGPADKEVWVWPKEAIDSASLARNPSFGVITFDIGQHIGSAKRYLLKPGDFLCIPKDIFHVFQNLGKSVFFGVSLYPTNISALTKQTLWNIIKEGFKASESIMSTGRMSEAINAAFRSYSDLEDLQLRISEELERERLRQETFGYVSSPHTSALPSKPPEPNAPYAWAYAGVIAAMDHQGGTELFIRGRSINFNRKLSFGKLVDATRNTHISTLSEISSVMPSGLNESSRHELIGHLYRFGAIINR